VSCKQRIEYVHLVKQAAKLINSFPRLVVQMNHHIAKPEHETMHSQDLEHMQITYLGLQQRNDQVVHTKMSRTDRLKQEDVL
jgi:hypothetical protein